MYSSLYSCWNVFPKIDVATIASRVFFSGGSNRQAKGLLHSVGCSFGVAKWAVAESDT